MDESEMLSKTDVNDVWSCENYVCRGEYPSLNESPETGNSGVYLEMEGSI